MRKVNSEDKRKGFVFYWGYYDAMQKLSNKNKLIAFEAIVQYERYQELDLEKLPKQVYPILIMAIPGIDKRIAEYNKKVAKRVRQILKRILKGKCRYRLKRLC